MDAIPFPADKMTDRQRLLAIIKERSFRRGHFVLASGQTSSYYLDLKPTMFHPEGADLTARLIFERIKDLDVDYVGGLEMGAVPLVATVAAVSQRSGKPIPGFFVRKAVKDHGTKRRIEAAGDMKDKRLVILEDVTTTGGSAMEAVKVVQQEGANIVLVLSVVDREQGAGAAYAAQDIPFDALFRASEFLAAS
jgi:orotate phosphoribosyltransferase